MESKGEPRGLKERVKKHVPKPGLVVGVAMSAIGLSASAAGVVGIVGGVQDAGIISNGGKENVQTEKIGIEDKYRAVEPIPDVNTSTKSPVKRLDPINLVAQVGLVAAGTLLSVDGVRVVAEALNRKMRRKGRKNKGDKEKKVF